MRTTLPPFSGLGVALLVFWPGSMAASDAPTKAVTTSVADLIVTNATIVTNDPQQPRASALAVRDGKFIAVGDDAAMERVRGQRPARSMPVVAR
jgi:hypothetical protein